MPSPVFHGVPHKAYLSYRHFRHSAGGVSYTPPQMAAIYNFPKGFTGAGKNAAVIELGGGYVQANLDRYFTSLGLHVKPVIFHSVDGGVNDPGDLADNSSEVCLDLCVLGGMAPGVQLHCYTAPNTDAGFLHAIEKAIADGMDAISISWGGAENQWSPQSLSDFNMAFALAASRNITVTAAAGDNGSGDGEPGQHVDFPASSPYVLGVGGTSLPSVSPLVELVWNDGATGGATGGGVSTVFGIPAYQKLSNIPGGTQRGMPDVAANADPSTGWLVEVNDRNMVIGGTSAGAPMWAALACVLSEALGHNVGHMHEKIYTMKAGFRDIVDGNNGTFIARPGYDCNTGMGVPRGDKLLALYQAAAVPPPVVPPPVVPPPVVPPPVVPPPPRTHTLIVSGGTVMLDGKLLS